MSEFHYQPIDPSLVDMSLDDLMTYKERHRCEGCEAEPDEDGHIKHGRACPLGDEETHVDPFERDPSTDPTTEL